MTFSDYKKAVRDYNRAVMYKQGLYRLLEEAEEREYPYEYAQSIEREIALLEGQERSSMHKLQAYEI